LKGAFRLGLGSEMNIANRLLADIYVLNDWDRSDCCLFYDYVIKGKGKDIPEQA
jgi:hypothetical protein